MNCFQDTDHLYQVLDALFQRLATEETLAQELVSGNLVLRFCYHDPEGQVTMDLRQAPITWKFGETELEPELTMIQSADVAHRFWLGRLSIPRAIATRQVVSRGPVRKALKLLPALKPAYSLYPQVLRDLGYEELAAQGEDAASSRAGWRAALKAALFRLREALLGRFAGAPPIDWTELTEGRIPLVDEVPKVAVSYRDRSLPTSPPELKCAMLERMLVIRAFEDRLAEAYEQGQVPTEAIHLSIGQEAVAVGVCFALRANDYLVTTHRGHGHMLAKDADLGGMLAEVLGKATGLCGGKGGSMHVTDAAVGALGANGIVGASPLIAAGAAHSIQQRGTDQVAVAFLGDGATNQGMFHEAVNFAAVLDLPTLFVIENNQYGQFTSAERHARVARFSDRAAAYGIPGVTVDGNDPWAVYEATIQAVERARNGGGPTLLECLTYRWHGHMEGESVDYRQAEEVRAWKERCPIKRMRTELEEAGTLSATESAELEGSAATRIAEAFALALEAPAPPAETLVTDVYAPEPSTLFAAREPTSATREITCAEALREALTEEMARDERVYLLGEDVTTGGYFAMTVGLLDHFGKGRVVDTPISEYAIVGSAVGAAMTGMRPVAEILFSDFLTTCMDPLVNQAAKLRYMSGGQYTVPLTVRTPGGAGLGMAAQHSQSLEALLTGVPGLIVLAPATPYDAKGLLKAAIRSNNPVLFFENKVLYAATGPVPETDYLVPLGKADVKRPGTEVSVVSIGAVLPRVLEAAEELAREGIDAEVIDVLTLVPLDMATIVRSVLRTGRLVTVEDGALFHGFGAEVVARVVESAFGALRSPPRRVAGLDVPIPYNSTLENAAIPDAGRIREAVHGVLSRGRARA
ncbi:pyruvate dehydrogenase complex E1 component subunit beta [Planctomycetota bacterium]